MRIAIPRFGESVAPCFEYSATITIFTVEKNSIQDQVDFSLKSREALDRLRLLRDQRVDTLICGGMQDVFEDMVRARGIEVISWVSGEIEELLNLYFKGELISGAGRLGDQQKA